MTTQPRGGLVAGDDVPLTGRAEDLKTVEERVGDPADPAGRAVLIVGEAGIGKSRLLASAGAAMRERGWTVFDIQADELDHMVPYAGLRHAIVKGLPAMDDDLASSARDLLTALDVAAAHSTASVRATASRFFTALTAERPVALAFDELAQSDVDTVVLVGHLLRLRGGHALVLLGNMRDREPGTPSAVTPLLERLRGEKRISEIALGRLSDDAIERIAATVLGPAADTAAWIDTIHRLSAGNPLFAIEASLSVRESGAAGEAAGLGAAEGIEFTEDRRRAFVRRVLRIDPPAAALSRAVALLGVVGHARVGLAAMLAGLTHEQADTAFDSLVSRGVLRLRDRNGYSVSHELVREALYQEIGPAQRWRWHRTAAEQLAALPSSPAVDLEIAHHIQHVAEVGDERAIATLTRAAERACDAAPGSSVGWYRKAIGVLPDEDARRPALLARLSRAYLLAGRPDEAVGAGLRALALMPEGVARTRLVTQVVDGMVLAGEMHDAVGLIDDELPRSASSLTFLAKAAHIHMGVGRAGEALDRAREVEAGLPSLSPQERIVAIGHLMRMRFVQRRVDELPRLCAMMERAADEAPAPFELAALAVVSYAHAGTGETRLASAAIARAQQVQATVGWTLYNNDLATAQVQNADHLGDWSAALSIIDATAHDLELTGSRMHLGVMRTAEIEILANRGDWAAARRAAEKPLSGDAHCDAIQVWARAGFHLLSGDLEAARSDLKLQLERPTMPRWVRALLLSRLADTEIAAGRSRLAAELVADLLDEGRDVVDHPTYVAVRLAHGRATGDVAELLEAMRVADAHALALHRGSVRLALGMLDHEAAEHLTEAARIFQTLGAAPWKQRAVAELRRRGMPLPRLRTRPSRLLTETEEQIVRLVQQRFTNREIASAVFLSVKTVEAYLSRIYTKTGCGNRVELARAVESGHLRPAGEAGPPGPR
ncbi:regulatory LuxR family protein [Actinocorallia herbida]|uniref:Regulatory LuxR family protein n=1 Tax=Actinocorallia herbida TaxID=58109 RepID=A0A3N1D0W1_9ACTN|nr:LuxR family transcriptional regulator [Actinocorallia herbida]ROO86688.1 regulatory LuxR family protein [Actinocorallia herbida]